VILSKNKNLFSHSWEMFAKCVFLNLIEYFHIDSRRRIDVMSRKRKGNCLIYEAVQPAPHGYFGVIATLYIYNNLVMRPRYICKRCFLFFTIKIHDVAESGFPLCVFFPETTQFSLSIYLLELFHRHLVFLHNISIREKGTFTLHHEWTVSYYVPSRM
jgi:hypothetical protein